MNNYLIVFIKDDQETSRLHCLGETALHALESSIDNGYMIHEPCEALIRNENNGLTIKFEVGIT